MKTPETIIQGNYIVVPDYFQNRITDKHFIVRIKVEKGLNYLVLYPLSKYYDPKNAIHLATRGFPDYYSSLKGGKIKVPQDWLDTCNLEEKCLFLGIRDYFEVWNPESLKINDLTIDLAAIGNRLAQQGHVLYQ